VSGIVTLEKSWLDSSTFSFFIFRVGAVPRNEAVYKITKKKKNRKKLYILSSMPNQLSIKKRYEYRLSFQKEDVYSYSSRCGQSNTAVITIFDIKSCCNRS
jgi:hypothetical protein